LKAPEQNISRRPHLIFMNLFKEFKLINLIKGIFIIVLAAAIVLSCSYILTLKSEDGISQFRSFYKQKEGTVDLLFMGSSHTYCNISTGVIWENYGISSFDLGGAEAPTWSTYFQMKEALKYQHPKVIALEVSTAAIRPGLDPPEFWIEDNAYGMKWNENRINLMKVQTNDWLFNRIVFPLSTMHQRYSELTADDFIDKNNRISYKGFDYRDSDVSFEVEDVSDITETGEITDRAEEYLYKIIELCKDENVELWFFITPYVITAEDHKIYNYIESIANEQGIPYVNLNDPEYLEEMNFDYSTDMADVLHVDIGGATKLSMFLGQYLQSVYKLEDHRGDLKYKSWDDDARMLRMERADVALPKAESDAEFLELLNEDGYEVFISFGAGVQKSTIPNGVMPALMDLGLTLDDITCGNAIILQNRNILFSGVTDEFKATTSNKYDNILFSRSKSGDENRAFETVLNINGESFLFEDTGIEVYVYDTVNSKMVNNRRIICE